MRAEASVPWKSAAAFAASAAAQGLPMLHDELEHLEQVRFLDAREQHQLHEAVLLAFVESSKPARGRRGASERFDLLEVSLTVSVRLVADSFQQLPDERFVVTVADGVQAAEIACGSSRLIEQQLHHAGLIAVSEQIDQGDERGSCVSCKLPRCFVTDVDQHQIGFERLRRLVTLKRFR